MKRLFTKPCPFCRTPIMGKKRVDRNAYHYAPRCPTCTNKAMTDEVKATKQRVVAQIRVQLPVGSKRLHKASDGCVYIRVKIAEPNKWEYEHRVLTAAPKGIHVHHKNGNTQDNQLSNLVLVTPKEHREVHGITQWSRKFTRCTQCGTQNKKHLSHGLCTTCYQRTHPPKK